MIQEDSDWPTRLLQRWFVKYNPIYLVSAASVLGGVYFLSAALARRSDIGAELGLSAVTESYQLALIGAAALLFRKGQKRPAVMLALIAMVYLLDVTLQTSVAPHLGPAGVWLSFGWLILFGTKVAALCWALRLRLSKPALASLALGALGLALFPQLLYGAWLRPEHAAIAVVAWLYVLYFFGGWLRPEIHLAERPSDAYVPIVSMLKRGTFIVGYLLLTSHAIWWSVELDLPTAVPLFALLPLFTLRFVAREGQIWALSAMALLVAVFQPATFGLIAVLLSVTLTLRLLLDDRLGLTRQVLRPPGAPREGAAHPYRLPEEVEAVAVSSSSVAALLSRGARSRLWVGAALSIYVAFWTWGWRGGAWPMHVLMLDALASMGLVLMSWRRRSGYGALAVVGIWVHRALGARVALSTMGWGVALLGGGFLALAVGVAVNLWMARPARSAHPRRAKISSQTSRTAPRPPDAFVM